MLPFSAEQWPAISRLLDQALETSEQDRAAWLARLIATRPELGQLVQMLLRARDRCRHAAFLEHSPRLSGPVRSGLLQLVRERSTLN